MSSYTSISIDKLARLIGTPNAPVLIDVRTEEDFNADPRLIPGSARRSHERAADWAPGLAGCPVVVICQKGKKLSEGTAAWLRHEGLAAETLECGFDGWKSAKRSFVSRVTLSVRRSSRYRSPRPPSCPAMSRVLPSGDQATLLTAPTSPSEMRRSTFAER